VWRITFYTFRVEIILVFFFYHIKISNLIRNSRINGKENVKNKSPKIKKGLKMEKTLDWGASRKTFRKAIRKPKVEIAHT
jgi:hypothetical protein